MDREPGEVTASANQDFVPLPGGEDEHGVGASHPRYEPFEPRKSGRKPTGHGISEHGSGEVLGSTSKWGVEGLLGSTAAANSGKGFAASAKSTIVSGFERLAAARGRSADDGVEQPCEYVAMSTPCESPVNKATGAPGSGSFSAITASPQPPPFKPSASSRAGLAARLGSALQSWTTSSGRGGGGDDGAASSPGPPREGRPGPFGAKYTQQQRTKSPEPAAVVSRAQRPQSRPAPPESSSSPHQSGGREEADTGSTGEAAAAASAVVGEKGVGAVAKAPPNTRGVTQHQNEAEEEGLEEEEILDEGGVSAVPDLIEVEAGNSKTQGNGLIRLGEAATLAATSETAVGAAASGATAANTSSGRRQQQQQVDGDAEAGAGSTKAQATAAAASAQPGEASAGETGGGGDVEQAIGDRDEQGRVGGGGGGGGRGGVDVEGGDGGGGAGGARKDQRQVDEKFTAAAAAAKSKKKRAVGLWELKAERSRLEQALAEAETERDVERARAREAADRVEEAVARLECLRRQWCGDNGGGGNGAAGAGTIAVG